MNRSWRLENCQRQTREDYKLLKRQLLQCVLHHYWKVSTWSNLGIGVRLRRRRVRGGPATGVAREQQSLRLQLPLAPPVPVYFQRNRFGCSVKHVHMPLILAGSGRRAYSRSLLQSLHTTDSMTSLKYL